MERDSIRTLELRFWVLVSWVLFVVFDFPGFSGFSFLMSCFLIECVMDVVCCGGWGLCVVASCE